MNATMWLDNALVELYVSGGKATVSAFVPALFGEALNGSVWAAGGVAASFAIEWNEVRSATFHPAASRLTSNEDASKVQKPKRSA